MEEKILDVHDVEEKILDIPEVEEPQSKYYEALKPEESSEINRMTLMQADSSNP